jgi:hypothetical protein
VNRAGAKKKCFSLRRRHFEREGPKTRSFFFFGPSVLRVQSSFFIHVHSRLKISSLRMNADRRRFFICVHLRSSVVKNLLRVFAVKKSALETKRPNLKNHKPLFPSPNGETERSVRAPGFAFRLTALKSVRTSCIFSILPFL